MAKLGEVPSEAKSGAQGNETTPAEQRTAERAAVVKGPKVGKAGEYLPAAYMTGKDNKIRREDH